MSEVSSAARDRRPEVWAAWIAVDPKSRRLLELAARVAAAPTTVLIRGESGVGKDLLAQLLHLLGPNAAEPLVKIDCASLPADLVESELFGYEKGAFTGAEQSKPGRLELAGRGTLVLDEVAALGLPLQAKLLRVLEEKRFERLGGRATIAISARLMALTNADLERAVAERTFREDLFYRLNVLPLTIPPLRERPLDIRPLAEHFIEQFAQLQRRARPRLTAEALAALERHDFPGNVRELRNMMERAFIAGGAEIALRDLPLRAAVAAEEKTLEQVEKEYIAAVLQRHRGKKSETARVLGISRKTLLEKRKRYHLD
ncbi:MAG TPA: sigma 54-interacting transcriptional regulator [Terriglobales bacterium]|nr:sigma 54-interacting transcriptional regulator [Terriglobales bacterium]